MICSRSTTASASGGGGSPSASDGFGDAAQDTNGPYQIVSGQPQGITSSVSSGGTSLFKKGSSASVTVATKQFTASASGSVGANDGGLLQAGYSFGAGVVSPPSVGVTAPTNDAIVMAGGDVTVSVHGDPTFLPDDSSNPLQSLSLKITGGTGGGGDLTPDGDGNASLDVGTLPTGMYTATVEAKYTNGSGTVTVDSQPVTFYVADFAVKTNSWNPNPAYVSQIITGQVQGKFDPSSLDGGGSGPFFVVYNWTTGGVWYSQDGTAGSFEPYGGNGVVSWQQGQADTTFSAQFFAPGQYLLEVQCVATVYSQSTGAAVAVFTQTGYIGGDASDIDASGGGQAGHAQKAHGRIAHAGGGGGITVLAATVTFDTTSVKLGLGSPQKYYAIIGATVTPAYQIGSVSFQALDPFGLPSDEVTVKVASQDLLSGALTLLITATSPTPATTGGSPDCTIAATVPSFVGAQTVASATALVLQPTFCSEVNPPDPKEANTYYVSGTSPDSIPYWLPKTISAGYTRWATECMTDVTITIYDQFHHQLDQMYDGNNIVDEVVTGTGITGSLSGPIQHPSSTLSGGVIHDTVLYGQNIYLPDIPEADKKWDNYGYLFGNVATPKIGWDNAISAQLNVPVSLRTLTQVLSIHGSNLSPTWQRQYSLYQRNNKQGVPMGPVAETAVPGT